MRVLIVDDDDHKRAVLADCVRRIVPSVEITEARSYKTGLREIIARPYDLAILDMTMPNNDVNSDDDGGRTQAYAGREILKQMDARDLLTPVVVVTQYERFGGPEALTLEELDDELRRHHKETYRGFVFFDITSPSWRVRLAQHVAAVVRRPQ